jgi:signal transduction histidine kinase
VKGELVRQTRLAAIGQIAASIAHELRNPLGAITNAAFYLGRREQPWDPKATEHLGIIVQEVQRSDRIIDDLLEMSRPKVAAKEHRDLGAVLHETFARLRGGARVELEVDLVPEPFFIEADGGQLRQVLANLITNAIQAMGSAGRIRVRARRGKDFDVMTFEDDGPGVPDEIRESIFEPLFTTKSKGTGLGLSICRQILDRHGGTIEVKRASGGAVFEIRLPRTG